MANIKTCTFKRTRDDTSEPALFIVQRSSGCHEFGEIVTKTGERLDSENVYHYSSRSLSEDDAKELFEEYLKTRLRAYQYSVTMVEKAGIKVGKLRNFFELCGDECPYIGVAESTDGRLYLRMPDCVAKKIKEYRGACKQCAKLV